VLVDRSNLARHRRWIIVVVAGLILTSGWYVAAGLAANDWPAGSSLPGFMFGVAGSLIILFEFLLWPRKHVRIARLGSAQAWLRAHIWLGLFVLPLLILHSGFRLGGALSTVLMVLLVMVVASGVVGLVFQQTLPRRLLEQIPQETVPTQLVPVREQLRLEAEEIVQTACGAAPPKRGDDGEAVLSYLPAGVSRSAGKPQPKLPAKPGGAPTADVEPLRRFYQNVVVPYLRRPARSPLRSATQAALLFQDLRDALEPELHAVADSLESLCERRRQFDEQARVHFWLHAWLWVHLPLSAALVVLMFVHAWVALKYW
jgi:hypothetical protein